jgi:hypothetical protein
VHTSRKPASRLASQSALDEGSIVGRRGAVLVLPPYVVYGGSTVRPRSHLQDLHAIHHPRTWSTVQGCWEREACWDSEGRLDRGESRAGQGRTDSPVARLAPPAPYVIGGRPWLGAQCESDDVHTRTGQEADKEPTSLPHRAL